MGNRLSPFLKFYRGGYMIEYKVIPSEDAEEIFQAAVTMLHTGWNRHDGIRPPHHAGLEMLDGMVSHQHLLTKTETEEIPS